MLTEIDKQIIFIAFSIDVFLNYFNPVFIVFVYQKLTLIGTMKHTIANHDKYCLFVLSCDVCEDAIITSINMIYQHSIELYHSS